LLACGQTNFLLSDQQAAALRDTLLPTFAATCRLYPMRTQQDTQMLDGLQISNQVGSAQGGSDGLQAFNKLLLSPKVTPQSAGEGGVPSSGTGLSLSSSTGEIFSKSIGVTSAVQKDAPEAAATADPDAPLAASTTTSTAGKPASPARPLATTSDSQSLLHTGSGYRILFVGLVLVVAWQLL